MDKEKIMIEKKLQQIIAMPQLQKDHYENFRQRAKDLSEQFNEKEFRVTVVGEFSAGKSTFLNALIGKDILPHSVNETTATVTYIKNVKSNDPLSNKVVIEFFYDKEPVVIDMPENAEGLTEYVTTMAQKMNVVQEVASVTLHVDFPYTEEPIVFIDTPGLNGVAKGHYERTRYEIQRAHTSIYLLHTRGLSQSNVQMYELLKQYQSSFIFVINAIDTLKEAEGETVERKVEELRKQLFEIGVNNNPVIIGASSLLALSAKDKSITKLYENDPNPMTEERRQLLLEKSNFKQVEAEIWQRLVTSDKEKMKNEYIAQKFQALITEIKTEFEEQVAIHEIKFDEQQMNQIDLRLNLAEQSKDDNLKTMHNFTLAKKSDIRSMLNDRVQQDIKEIYNQLESEIDADIAVYVKSANKPEIHMKSLHLKVQDRLKTLEGEVSGEYIHLLTELLADLYESAVLRIEKYYPKISIAKQCIDFSFVMEKTNLDNLSLMEKGAKLEEQISHLLNEQNAVMVKYKEDARKTSVAESELNVLQSQKNSVFNERQIAVNRLGRRPGIAEKTEYYQVEKRGLKKFWGWVTGSTYETRSRTVTDDSARREWDQKEEQLRAKYNTKERELTLSITAAQQRLQKYESSEMENESRVNQIQQKLDSLRRDFSILQHEKNEIYEKNKRLYYERQRKELLDTLETYLSMDLSKLYRKEIDKILSKELSKIDEAIGKRYEQSYKTYTEKLVGLKKHALKEAVPEEREWAEKNLSDVLKILA